MTPHTLADLADHSRSTFELYRAVDREAGAIRARHLQQVLRLTPLTMLANLCCGLLLLAVMPAPRGAAFWAWLAALTLLVLAGALGWWRSRGHAFTSASVRAFKRATRHAAALGIVWALLPALWFADAPPAQQMVMACVVSGMLGAGAFALAWVPAASLAYVGLIGAGGLLALARTQEPAFIVVAAMLLSYCAVLAFAAMAMARSATAVLRAQFEQQRRSELVALLLRDFEDNAHDVLWEIDRLGRFVRPSPRLVTLFGDEAGALQTHSLLQWLEPQGAAAQELLHALRSTAPFRDLPLQVDLGDGPRWWAFSAKPLLHEDGHVVGWHGVVTDISDQVRTARRLRELARQDALTGLANRSALLEALQQALMHGRGGVLLAIDLDHFKLVNDTLGHEGGDAALGLVADRLRALARPGDLLARLGGDDFVLLLPPLAERELQALTQRLLQRLAEPVQVDERVAPLGASIGVVWLPTAAAVPASEAGELLANADLALREAKALGRGRVASYTPALGEQGRRSSRIERALREGTGRFELHYQPQVVLAGGGVRGVEALLRWQHPELGPVPTTEVVAAAERGGHIHELGRWVLREACAAAARLPGLTMAVNVSPLQLQRPGFVDEVRRVLADTSVEPERLELEITESVLLEDAGVAIEQLHRLRALGLRIVLDDFGTGYSSLAYLRRFPFDELKIDRSFVAELSSRADARAIVQMVVQLAAELGMRTVAEGVETPEQLERIGASGCQAMQGYLVSQALPLEELRARRLIWAERPALAQVH